MFRPRLQVMGQVLAKRLDTGVFFHQVKRNHPTWRVLGHPLAIRFLIAFLLLFYVGVPVWFYFCPSFRRHAVFLNLADWPFQDLSSPQSYGLTCTRNFFVETAPGVLLGVWHILPGSLQRNCSARLTLPKYPFEEDTRPVVLYLHGSAESRSAAYRRSMYKVLSRTHLDFHVITFDYRGFGDSSYVAPTVDTIVDDAAAMYNWLKTQVPTSRIYVWGHSLGSSVAIRIGEKTNMQGDNPLAIILEAPFTSVADATHTFPLSFFHRHLPFFKNFCSDRTRHADTNFNSDERIGKVSVPMLLLHAADDSMVWAQQGRRLWKRAVDDRPAQLSPPVFVQLDGKYGCGHRNIHKAPNLPYVVAQFVESHKLVQ